MFRKTTRVLALLAISTSIVQAACDIEKGTVSILSDDYPALHTVATRAMQCTSDMVEVTKNQTTEHKNIQVPALTVNPAEYSVAFVSNNSLVPLLNDDLVQPLDELVEKYGQDLLERQMIRIDGKVMAIAFMVNSQYLWYREDLFGQAGLTAPESFEDVLASAKVLREQDIIENPMALNLKAGWDLGNEFINMYTGFGGELFDTGSGEVTINNAQGIKALELLKELSAYMSPDFVTYNTSEVTTLWQSGQVAMYNGWGSRAGSILDPEGNSTDVVRQNTKFMAAPTAGGGDVPATHLWWVGFSLAKNTSAENAEASFKAMMHALSAELLVDHADQAVWLIKGFEPNPASTGDIANVEAGARAFPMLPYVGLLHTALGDNLSEYLQGQESAEQALIDATYAYTTAAREGGFLK